jgi:amino acid adenylation domain-containing protein
MSTRQERKENKSSINKDHNDKIKSCTNDDFIRLFYKQVKTNPNEIAISDEDAEITYDELNKKSNRLAKHLKLLGVEKENLVGLCSSLNVNFIICMLGILKSGAAYFPLDPTYPSDRLQFMLEDGMPPIILTETKYIHLFDSDRKKIIKIDEHFSHPFVPAFSEENDVEEFPEPSDLAYVIYTSGSTGTPKGIMITHESLSNVAFAHKPYYPSDIRMLISGGVCFDASLLVIFHALINNEQLYLFNYNSKDDVDILIDFIISKSINYIICVPSHYTRLLQKNQEFPSLKCVSLTGETLPSSLCNSHAKLAPNAFLYNEYGPSECAIGTTIAKIYDPKNRVIKKITVGKPLQNTKVYILDHTLCTLPKGVKGEICIGGIGLARGYLNNEPLTAQKFIWTTLQDQKQIRLYRTGDSGRILPNGELEFLGRIDHRVQIRGNWIDLGEVEYHISHYSDIEEYAVLTQTDSEDEIQLVVYITSKHVSAKRSLLDYLKDLLPEHMIPSSVVKIDKFPLSPNGKIDRNELANLYA